MKWVDRQPKRNGSRNGTGASRPVDPGPQPFQPERDYTADIIDFLRRIHGTIRRTEEGDFYYGDVSTISLHFLLGSQLPSQEILWSWYRYFDLERSESIYQTLRPMEDERFLEILGKCRFRWDERGVRDSGLIFLRRHGEQVYGEIERCLVRRLDHYRTLADDELREWLKPANTWSEAYLRRQVRKIRTRPFLEEHRQAVYDLFDSDYLRATARHILDEAATDAFWRDPPPELEAMKARFSLFTREMLETARRLGVYVSREAYEWSGWNREWESAWRGTRGRRFGFRREAGRARPSGETQAANFAILGLTPAATLVEVKSAYRERVKQCHPDQGGTVQEFLRLQEAYEYLLTEVY